MSNAMGEKLATRLGPLSPSFSLVKAGPVDESPDECESVTAAAPLIKPSAFLNPMANLKSREVVGHVVFPRHWVPRAGIIAATRMGDSAMMPMIPLGATVVIDVRPVPLEKAVGLIAAIGYASRGLRIRRIEKSMTDERYSGVSITEHARAKMPIRADKGDRIIGLIIGVLAQIN